MSECKTKFESESPIWLVWEQPTNGTMSLRAVATSKAMSDMYRKMIKDEGRDLIKVWAEERVSNHLYAHYLHILSAFRVIDEEL